MSVSASRADSTVPANRALQPPNVDAKNLHGQSSIDVADGVDDPAINAKVLASKDVGRTCGSQSVGAEAVRRPAPSAATRAKPILVGNSVMFGPVNGPAAAIHAPVRGGCAPLLRRSTCQDRE